MVLGSLRDLIRGDDGPAIVVEGLTETFRLYHEKPGGLNEYGLAAYKMLDDRAARDHRLTADRRDADRNSRSRPSPHGGGLVACDATWARAG